MYDLLSFITSSLKGETKRKSKNNNSVLENARIRITMYNDRLSL